MALALCARRMVRNGERARNIPQRLVRENRARAVALGLRARFDQVEPDRSATAEGGPRRAADCIRDLLLQLAPELGNLRAAAEELAPVLLGIDLPRFGGPAGATERAMVDGWVADGDAALAAGCHEAMTDPEPGGPLLREHRLRHRGQVAALLRWWQRRIDAPSAPSGTESPQLAGRAR
jgi:hypothetical protein